MLSFKFSQPPYVSVNLQLVTDRHFKGPKHLLERSTCALKTKEIPCMHTIIIIDRKMVLEATESSHIAVVTLLQTGMIWLASNSLLIFLIKDLSKYNHSLPTGSYC